MKEVISNGFIININKGLQDSIFENIQLLTDKNIKAGEYTRVALKLKTRSDIEKAIINPYFKLPKNSMLKNTQWEKGTVLTDYRHSVSEMSQKSANLKVNVDSISSSVKNIEGDYIKSSDIEQLNDSWTATFKDGYKEGIVTMNKDGIEVTSSAVKSKTSMSANGFKITKTDTNEDVFKVDSDGTLGLKGNIKSSTFSSADDIFQVLEDGTVQTDYLNVGNEISTDSLTVNKINNAKYQEVLTANTTVYVRPSASSDSSEFEDGAIYKSFDTLLSSCPQNLNGNTLNIKLEENVTENVKINKINSGTLYINLCGKTLYGHIYMTGESMLFGVYGNTSSSTGGTTIGTIKPNAGYNSTGGDYSIAVAMTNARIFDLKIYGAASGTQNKSAISVSTLSKSYMSNIEIFNCYSFVRSYASSHVYVSSSKGLSTSVAYSANSGSIIALNNTTQAGRRGSTSHIGTAGNGQVWSTGVTFTTEEGTPDTTHPPSPGTTKTVTLTSNYGDSYRRTVYNNWKKDGTVRQGDYGYGDCVGCWFFGTRIANYTSKNITKVEITVTRQAGGVNAAVTHTLKAHSYENRPTGSPTFRTDLSKNFSLSVGKSATITLSTTAEINAFKSCKGLGLVPISQTKTYYSVCSGRATVKITYIE